MPDDSRKAPRGFLRRLRRDASGNTLALVGAALVPLTAMIGSGVDLSRAYMAKTRLQSACDAASLAARRTMTNDSITDAVRAEATKYFNFNFPQNLYQTAAFTPTVTKPQPGTVRIQASTTIPTQIMRMFGFQTLPLSVDCTASQNFVNTDVVLVLDTTGSMACSPSDSENNCTTYVGNNGHSTNGQGYVTEKSDARIKALRDAVLALYDELKPVQDELAANGMRLRYGIVPYSSTVNVGKLLYDKDPTYLANSWTYQSKSPIYSTSSTTRVGNSMTNSQCNAYAQAKTPANSYPAVAKTVARPGNGTNRPCDVTTINYTRNETDNFANWFYEPRVLDTTTFKTFSANVALPTRDPDTTTKATVWTGCIEERDTVDTIDGNSGYAIPAGATDLNIDLVPNSNETRWRPLWPQVEYFRNGADSSDSYRGNNSTADDEWAKKGYSACPSKAKRLDTFTRDQMSTYVNGMVAIGGTYHDIGMIWGARLISAAGVFADSPDTFNGMPVSKHIIFMTDGALSPNSLTYGAYGSEMMDQRVTGASSAPNQLERHKQRFLMMCNAIRGKNVTIWAVAFATAADASLTTCTGNASQVSTSTDRDALIAKFVEIGKNIGALRLTQ